MKIKMTVDEALEFADVWSKGTIFYESSMGWRAVCMLLAEEVRRLRNEKISVSAAPAIDCRTCTSYVKNSCWSAIKCTNGDMYLGNILIQCWTK
jgi:hypothetical protein